MAPADDKLPETDGKRRADRIEAGSGTLKPLEIRNRGMDVTCDVVGGETHELEVAADATYGDLLKTVGLSTQEASVLVDDSPVPEDRSVDADSVRVIRLIKGG